jgi:hypothetical protein
MTPAVPHPVLQPVHADGRKTPLMKKILVIVAFHAVLLAILCPVFARTPEQNTYAHYMKTRSEQMKAGDYQAVRDSFERTLKYNASTFDVHIGLGVA